MDKAVLKEEIARAIIVPLGTNRVKCLAQQHNKQTCWFVLHTMSIVLSAKQGSCEYHFLKFFGMTRLRK